MPACCVMVYRRWHGSRDLLGNQIGSWRRRLFIHFHLRRRLRLLSRFWILYSDFILTRNSPVCGLRVSVGPTFAPLFSYAMCLS